VKAAGPGRRIEYMFDTHLLNVALMGIALSVAVTITIAASAVALIWLNERGRRLDPRRSRLTIVISPDDGYAVKLFDRRSTQSWNSEM
jgi:hypothetical protein